MPEPFLNFEGRRVVVTGASSGIGRAVAIELARNGAQLVLIGRNQARLEETAIEIDDPLTRILCFDLVAHAETGPRIKGVSDETGRIYGLCHCAGVVETRPLSSCKIEGIKAMMDINVSAGIELTRAVCRRDVMEETGGSILFVSSIYGLVGMPGQIGYSATKGAIAAAARAMAMELAPRKIRVNSISPGLVRTAMIEESFAKLSEEQVKKIEGSFPLGIGQLADIAKAACFLLAPQSRWITGIDLVVDGGYTAQ
jgi:NAD(P)-dependent dehydrogenase (short-subunit alcohol dehydrogenase family)